jgi:hypothetical protein
VDRKEETKRSLGLRIPRQPGKIKKKESGTNGNLQTWAPQIQGASVPETVPLFSDLAVFRPQGGML